MFTTVHTDVFTKHKKDAIIQFLYDNNINQLRKEGKVITETWKAICQADANDSVNELIYTGNLNTYYERYLRGAV